MAATYEAIATTTLASAASSVTFGSGGVGGAIPSTYTDLVLVGNYVQSASTAFTGINMKFNNDSSTLYSFTVIQGNGSASQSFRTPNNAFGEVAYQDALGQSNFITNIMNYSNTTTYKSYLSRANNPGSIVQAYVGLWRNTAAINALTISTTTSTFAIGTTLTLYGVKSA